MDKLTNEQRTRNMKAVKSKGTKLEEMVNKELWTRGIRYRKNNKNLLGKPDISIQKYKVVIFIDSCYWHGCEQHGSIPATNREFWVNKIKRNKERDNEVTEYYQNKGWNLLRIWEHDLKRTLKVH
ncbi:DNA mismatch endonuclease (patch repair protein) [Bacillus sp. SORGH_AS 510]|uniref:very short patch repair endonuclease n=1 Tax=Bacillus sp. SORGH_AS_0510 TaxID=3041771 RepID=UPI0027891008|nr:very short patch repair endonuclease [Bacillus sp. SORGH_AS_0510]MDQ1147032.1 DNA mismatch endonuclease (patch repair protein) [Bacillus sp. SORGH_AS_0510]